MSPLPGCRVVRAVAFTLPRHRVWHVAAPTRRGRTVAAPVDQRSNRRRVGNGPSDSPVVSADGTCVAFQSAATNLVADDTNDGVDVFVRDIVNNTTRRVSVASDGAQANGHSYEAAVSGDCRYVAFTSLASNLVAGDTNGVSDVFVHDLTTHVTTRVSSPPRRDRRHRGRLVARYQRRRAIRRVRYRRESPSERRARLRARSRHGPHLRDRAAGSPQPEAAGDQRRRALRRVHVVCAHRPPRRLLRRRRVAARSHRRRHATHRGRRRTRRSAARATRNRRRRDRQSRSWSRRIGAGLARCGRGSVRVFDRITGETRGVAYQRMPGWPSHTGLSCTIPPCGATSRPSLDASGRQVGLSQDLNAASHVFDLWIVDRWAATGVRVGATTDYATMLTANTSETSLSGDGHGPSPFAANVSIGASDPTGTCADPFHVPR